MPEAIIRCLKCGETYSVDSSDLDRLDIMYSCNKCGGEIAVEFFDHCCNCGINVGFYSPFSLKKFAMEMTENILKGLSNPLDAIMPTIKNFANITVTESNGDGVCPLCGSRYIRCRQCNELTLIPRETSSTDTFHCRICNTELLPNGVKNDFDARCHSQAFYYEDNLVDDTQSYLQGEPHTESIGYSYKKLGEKEQKKFSDYLSWALDHNPKDQEAYSRMKYYVMDIIQGLTSDVVKSEYYFLLSVLKLNLLSDTHYVNANNQIDYAGIQEGRDCILKAIDLLGDDPEYELLRKMYDLWFLDFDEGFKLIKGSENLNLGGNTIFNKSYLETTFKCNAAFYLQAQFEIVLDDEDEDEARQTFRRLLNVDAFIASMHNDEIWKLLWIFIKEQIALCYAAGIGVVRNDNNAYELVMELLNYENYSSIAYIAKVYEDYSDIDQFKKYLYLIIDNVPKDHDSYKWALGKMDTVYVESESDNSTNGDISKTEEEYLVFLKEILEDGKITDKERKILNKMRISFGISESRAEELELMILQTRISEFEQEYMAHYLEFINGSMEILPRHRKLLVSFAKINGITAERAKELEKIAKKSL